MDTSKNYFFWSDVGVVRFGTNVVISTDYDFDEQEECDSNPLKIEVAPGTYVVLAKWIHEDWDGESSERVAGLKFINIDKMFDDYQSPDSKIVRDGFKQNAHLPISIGEIYVEGGFALVYCSSKNPAIEEWYFYRRTYAINDGQLIGNQPEYEKIVHKDSAVYSETGFGDGAYEVYGLRGTDEALIGIELVFVDEDEYWEVNNH